MSDEGRFEVKSNTTMQGKPFITAHVTDMDGRTTAWQWTPAEARAHAFQVLEAAEAAEHDAYVVRWMRETVKFDDDKGIAVMLNELREFRDKETNS